MNAVTKVEAAKPSLIAMMAAKHNMDPEQFAKTVRATVMPANHTNEQFAALMLVAQEYDLNPIVKEIYAFPAKGGGIVPIVSIDGWINLVNSHPSCDGFEFDVDHDDKGELVSITCRMFRKDRSRPVVVTEYYDECKRATDPWKMKHRMLRHKAMIQAARYAFGFSGIYDEDEGAKIAEMRDVTPVAAPRPPVPPSVQIATPTEQADAETGEIIDDAEIVRETGEDVGAVMDDWPEDDVAFFAKLKADMAAAATLEALQSIWDDSDALSRYAHDETQQAIAISIQRTAFNRIGGGRG